MLSRDSRDSAILEIHSHSLTVQVPAALMDFPALNPCRAVGQVLHIQLARLIGKSQLTAMVFAWTGIASSNINIQVACFIQSTM